MKTSPILALTLFIAIDFMPREKLRSGPGEYLWHWAERQQFLKHISSCKHFDLHVKDFARSGEIIKF